MKRSYVKRAVALVLLSTGVMTLLALASPYETCLPPVVNTVPVATHSPVGNAMPHKVSSHCLVYGKYCLGEALRGG
jgi:hypothetical protein